MKKLFLYYEISEGESKSFLLSWRTKSSIDTYRCSAKSVNAIDLFYFKNSLIDIL